MADSQLKTTYFVTVSKDGETKKVTKKLKTLTTHREILELPENAEKLRNVIPALKHHGNLPVAVERIRCKSDNVDFSLDEKLEGDTFELELTLCQSESDHTDCLGFLRFQDHACSESCPKTSSMNVSVGGASASGTASTATSANRTIIEGSEQKTACNVVVGGASATSGAKAVSANETIIGQKVQKVEHKPTYAGPIGTAVQGFTNYGPVNFITTESIASSSSPPAGLQAGTARPDSGDPRLQSLSEEEKSRVPTTTELNNLSSLLADDQKWKRLSRELGVRDEKCSEIISNYPKDVREQAYQMLSTWKLSQGKSATVLALCHALIAQDLVGIVTEIFLKKT